MNTKGVRAASTNVRELEPIHTGSGQKGVFTRQSPKHAFLSVVLLLFPFSVLFCPRLDLAITHARIDELLLAAWIVFWLPTSLMREIRGRGRYFWPFLVLFGVFLLALLAGDDPRRWSQSNLKLVTRPVVIILNVIALTFFLRKSNANFRRIMISLIAATAFAGLLGYVAMLYPRLAEFLKAVYYPDILHHWDWYGFDMSTRAMSVFTGYDVASVTYAFGILLSVFLFFNAKGPLGKALCVVATLSFLIFILTSARTGFIATIAGLAVLVILSMKYKPRKGITVALLVTVLMLVFVPIGRQIVAKQETVHRFSDVLNIFDFSSERPFWQRSQGINVLVTSQMHAVGYPQGLQMLFGKGDRGEFVSDVGYVTIYVKYGILGIFVIIWTIVSLGFIGLRNARRVWRSSSGKNIPFNALLPAVMIMFAVCGLKGTFYFMTYQVGELFALFLAICIVEGTRPPNVAASPDVAASTRTIA